MGTKATKSLFHLFLIIGTIFIGGILGIAALARFINPANSSMMPILGIAMPAIIILNVAIAFIWLAKRKIYVIIPIIAILCNWHYLSSMYQIRHSEPKTGDMKISTFNVRSFNNDYTGFTAKEILNYMSESNVDILCMQEYSSIGNFNTDSVNALFSSKYKYSFVPKQKNGKTRVAIFSTHPIVGKAFVPFKGTANCAMWCDIIKGNDTIRVFNLHLQTTSLTQQMNKNSKQNTDTETAITSISGGLLENSVIRARQALQIQRLIKKTKYPILLCGDFNDTPASFTYETINDVMTDGYRECGNGYGATYRYLASLFRIDYVFTSKDIEGCDYSIIDKEWSDHKPVMMELRLKTE